jgi:hypothetical protein
MISFLATLPLSLQGSLIPLGMQAELQCQEQQTILWVLANPLRIVL